MKRFLNLYWPCVWACLCVFGGSAHGALLWQIGQADRRNAEFALAPNHFADFKQDGFYVVGESDARRDWAYVHPGPYDAWAGARQHTFFVLFGLKSAPRAGDCRLQVALLDTQSQSPPKLRIEVNNQAFEQVLPRGGGDTSVNGDLSQAKGYRFDIPFSASLLREGDNEIRITTVSGSWLLYDWLGLEAPAGTELAGLQARTLVDSVQPVRALREVEGKLLQPVMVGLKHFGAPAEGSLRVEGADPLSIQLNQGDQVVELMVPAVSEEARRSLTVEVAGKALPARTVVLKPARKLTVYLLPHSHTDIGYTEIQTQIEKKQVNNLLEGIAYARRTANYPPGARFVWNVEVLWAADLYLHRLNETQRADFFDAVKKGQVVLNGMYLNELTGLCRPEELVQLFRFATLLAQQTGVPIDSAMISDVPGYTWGTVTAMAQAGIKYFSAAPNYFDRIGTIMRDWENKPFYWVGPDGHSKVLVWIPFWGYAMSHIYGKLSPRLVEDFCDGLQKRGYDFDIAYARWSGHGDNATPDPAICEFVKDWNAKYTWPKFVISGTSEAFRAFEERYGSRLPLVRGDWTPYWEDGAGSSALETGVNRASSDRLVQAESLFAMLRPESYPVDSFREAWRNVLLYSEHTWGADCSISQPESQKTREQWEIKRSYALDADRQSRALLQLAIPASSPVLTSTPLQVVNTTSWPRTELVQLDRETSTGGDRVLGESGAATPSQRLADGTLAFMAQEVPAFGARKFTIGPGSPAAVGNATVQGAILDNGKLRVRLDERTGGIVELRARDIEANLVDLSGGEALNDYLYLRGDDLKALERNGPVKITAKEKGPLVASLVVESDAPGCRKLTREVRVVAGLEYVELIDTVDKARLDAKDYHAKEGKESLNFAFPFNVAGGELLFDLPLAVMRPDLDQMMSACKNWLTVGRWVEVANPEFGVTWVTLDAPLVQVGGLTARLLNSQTNPDVWSSKVGKSQRLYCWAMNNHWGTNYRAYQEGPTIFRFILRPHRQSTPAAATQFATGFSQPLLVAAASGESSPRLPFQFQSADVVVSALKPSDDGRATIVRLFGASGKDSQITLAWVGQKPKRVWLSNTSEQPLKKLGDTVSVPAWALVTLRVEKD